MLTTIDGCDLFRRIDGRLARERRRPVVSGIDHLSERTSYAEDDARSQRLGFNPPYDAGRRARYLTHGPKVLDYTPNLPTWW